MGVATVPVFKNLWLLVAPQILCDQWIKRFKCGPGSKTNLAEAQKVQTFAGAALSSGQGSTPSFSQTFVIIFTTRAVFNLGDGRLGTCVK